MKRLALAACLFFIVLGSRWATVNYAATDVPEWDQWDAEGLKLLAPWFQHRLAPGAFLAPQNEHRIVLTQALNFTLTLANGQWDQRLEAAINALFPALIAAGLFAFASGNMGRRWHPFAFVIIAAAYSLPLGWQNVLGGFHSPQFLLIGLSFGAIGLLPRSDPGTGPWWLGAACAVLALGTLASGFFAAAVVLGLVALRWIRGESSLAKAGPTLVLCAIVVAVGWFTRVFVDYHEFLKAQDAHDFLMTLVRNLRWPVVSTGWAAVLLWLPWAWLTGRVILCGDPATRAWGMTLAGFGGWALLQIVATAYARGAGAPEPASRYLDTLLAGSVANALALGWLWANGAKLPESRTLLTLLGIGWTAAFAAGAGRFAWQNITLELPYLRFYHTYCEQNVRRYVATGDPAYLQHEEIPYPGSDSLLVRLAVPELRAILPASAREPDAVVGAGGGAFIRYDSRGRQAREAVPASYPALGPTGFSPGTYRFTDYVTWGSFGTPGEGSSTWRSRPMSIRRPGWLKFVVAGELGEPGLALELRDARTDALLASVRPDRVPGETWRPAYVRAPDRPFVIAATRADPSRWFAFSEPAEMARGSHWAWCAVRHGALIAEIAAGAAVFLWIAGGRRRTAADIP